MLPDWVEVIKDRFGEMKSIVTEAKTNKLKTSVDKKIITVKSMEELVKGIASRKIKSKKEAKGRFNAKLDNGISEIAGLKRYAKNQNTVQTFSCC